MEISSQRFWIKNQQRMDKNELLPDFIEKGVSLYEVLRVIQGVPLFLECHLARLKHSAQLTQLELPLDDHQISQRLLALINSNQVEQGNIKFVLNYPAAGQPADFYAYFVEHDYPSPEDYCQGVKTVLVQMERPNPNAKIDRADYRKRIDEAKRKTGSYEALLVDRERNVSEGGRSNLFMIKDEMVYTAPANKVLKGITRKMVLVACENRGYTSLWKKKSAG
jgi:branched-chain amino acid aminotransferase